jgi:alkylation response protein AidB-like acyl-CoA dehydrogenase
MNPRSDQRQDELRMLRESVRTLLERAGGVSRARKARGKGFDRAVLAELAEAGVLGLDVPEAVGGLGMGLAAAGIVAEEMGRALAPEPVVPTMALAVGMLHRLCQGSPLLQAAVRGESVFALAWQERERGDPMRDRDLGGCRFEGGLLTGTTAWVAGAAQADKFLVVGRQQAEPVLVAVDAGAAGVSVTKRRQADGSDLCEIRFEEAPATLLSEGQAVGKALANAVADATALAAAELLGVASKALELTLNYVKVREQFGKPIGAFQVIQHRLVDMHIAREIAAAGIGEALGRMGAADSLIVRAREASRAKARAGTAALKITREAIQLHGAVGYTDEFDVGLFLNRALVLSAWLGNATHHRRHWLASLGAQEASL